MVHTESLRHVRNQTARLDYLLHSLELEPAAVPSAGLAHRIIILLAPFDSYLGVPFFGARSTCPTGSRSSWIGSNL